MELKSLLTKLTKQENLTGDEAAYAIELMTSEYSKENPVGVGVLLALLAVKGETDTEITAFAKHMREKCTEVAVPDGRVAIDIVGTGGDGANTVNISTASAVIAASCGATVTKHGSIAVSSRSGSADVLLALGIPHLQPENISKCLESSPIAFMFAPYFHPAMASVSPIRKAIQIRSVFNILGPLLNPAKCSRMVIGVYKPSLLPIFGQVMLDLGIEHGLVVHCGGLDELHCFAKAQVVEVRGLEYSVEKYELDPEADIGIPEKFCTMSGGIKNLEGGDAQDNAKTLERLFKGEERDTCLSHTVAYNAGAGLYVSGIAATIKEGYEIALTRMNEGHPISTLTKWREASQALSNE